MFELILVIKKKKAIENHSLETNKLPEIFNKKIEHRLQDKVKQ